MLLSICIPSYNRGRLALELVEDLLEIGKKYPNDIEIVISNNGSTKGKDEYGQIEKLSNEKENLVYFQFDENKQFVGNYNQVLRLAHGEWCLMLSDEDGVIEDQLEYYIEYMKANQQVSIIRANTDFNYCLVQEEKYKTAGEDALDDYFLLGNYLSGVIYNRNYLTNEVVDRLEELYMEDNMNKGYFSYPHMFVEALLLISGDFYRCERILIHEGKNTNDQIMNEELGVPFYASFEERLDQAHGYIEFISKLNCTPKQKALMIRRIIDKTFYLVSMQKENYKKSGSDYNNILSIITEELKTYLFISDIEVFKIARNEFCEYIDIIEESYRM